MVGFNFKLETKLETRHAANGRCHRDALKVSAPIPSTLALPFIARLSADSSVADPDRLRDSSSSFLGKQPRPPRPVGPACAGRPAFEGRPLPSSQGSRLSYRRLFGADDDDWDGGQCGDSFQAIQDQETAASRRSEIQQDRIRSCVTGRRDCLKGIGRVDRLVAVPLQPQTQQEPRIRIISMIKMVSFAMELTPFLSQQSGMDSACRSSALKGTDLGHSQRLTEDGG